jgi:hypothetical protein
MSDRGTRSRYHCRPPRTELRTRRAHGREIQSLAHHHVATVHLRCWIALACEAVGDIDHALGVLAQQNAHNALLRVLGSPPVVVHHAEQHQRVQNDLLGHPVHDASPLLCLWVDEEPRDVRSYVYKEKTM